MIHVPETLTGKQAHLFSVLKWKAKTDLHLVLAGEEVKDEPEANLGEEADALIAAIFAQEFQVGGGFQAEKSRSEEVMWHWDQYPKTFAETYEQQVTVAHLDAVGRAADTIGGQENATVVEHWVDSSVRTASGAARVGDFADADWVARQLEQRGINALWLELPAKMPRGAMGHRSHYSRH